MSIYNHPSKDVQDFIDALAILMEDESGWASFTMMLAQRRKELKIKPGDVNR